MAKKAASKVKVSERALFARFSRSLAKEGRVLKRCRVDSRWYGDNGDYYIVDERTNSVEAQHVDLEAEARAAGLLKEYEVLAKD